MNISEIFKYQAQFFKTGKTINNAWRKQQLKQLKRALTMHSNELQESLYQDLGKPPIEAYSSEIAVVLRDIDNACNNLDNWSKPKTVSSPLLSFYSRSSYYPVPYGSVLIIGPWNYPLGLILQPLVAALTAGNCAVLKPSEFTPYSSKAISNIISKYFGENIIAVFFAGAEETDYIIKSGAPDYVFFTGGISAGKKIMTSCSQHLIPLTLELGGCNPCIVEPDIPINIAAQRIIWGKFFNAGQTCVAPNVCYVHEKIYKEFICALKITISNFYNGNKNLFKPYSRIINSKHFKRLEHLIQKATGLITFGGERNKNSLYWAPILIEYNFLKNEPVLSDEIFGPILPVIKYSDIRMVLEQVENLPAPLIFYLFTNNQTVQNLVRLRTVSGNFCINGTLHILASGSLPFGGIRQSGMGRYHGKAGFDTFSYLRSELKKTFYPELNFLYPPYRVPLYIFKRIIKLLLR